MAKKQPVTIHVKVRTLDELKAFIQEIPRYYRGTFVEATAKSLVEYLKISEPPYKYVGRDWAYGLRKSGITGKTADSKGYFSLAQRAKVMAILRERGWTGKGQPPPYVRTGATAAGWKVEQKGVKAEIVNKTEGARWTMSNYWQARQPALVGWQKVNKVIADNLDDAMIDGLNATLERMSKKGK